MDKEPSTVVKMKEGVTRRDICCCDWDESGLKIVDTKAGRASPDGRIHRVAKNNSRRLKLVPAKTSENSRDRNISAPTNLQLTVHLKRNCLVNSKARPIYPYALIRRNGKAMMNCAN